MVTSQISVLNQSFSGATGGTATAFAFQLQKINRITNPAWYPIVQGLPGRALDEDLAA